MSEGCKVVNLEFENIADREITMSSLKCNARYQFRNCAKLWISSSKEIPAFYWKFMQFINSVINLSEVSVLSQLIIKIRNEIFEKKIIAFEKRDQLIVQFYSPESLGTSSWTNMSIIPAG